ncbi:kirola-like [Cornus florida]|uniref:kirola-like n=1 Tax=Cornus florida TaxID=4283 RepID=UPI00289C52F9|nr:kirola-like [Cornus florida]
MALTGKLVSQTEIKSDGDLFHDMFRKPHGISNICPDKVKAVNLHEGDWGTVGSVISWKYVHDGKVKNTKQIIEAVDDEKKSVTFKIIEGDLTELYKNFILTVHVDAKGESNLVTWTLEYEKLKADVPDPATIMDILVNVTKDIETHHLQK